MSNERSYQAWTTVDRKKKFAARRNQSRTRCAAATWSRRRTVSQEHWTDSRRRPSRVDWARVVAAVSRRRRCRRGNRWDDVRSDDHHHRSQLAGTPSSWRNRSNRRLSATTRPFDWRFHRLLLACFWIWADPFFVVINCSYILLSTNVISPLLYWTNQSHSYRIDYHIRCVTVIVVVYFNLKFIYQLLIVFHYYRSKFRRFAI